MWAYSVIILLAVVAAAATARLTQRDLGLASWQKWAVGFGGFCGAMIGAKLPFVFADWPGMVSGVAWFSDGKTILLGLAGGYAGVEAAKWALEIRTRTGDTFAVPVAIAISIGRWGCFVGGCCYGTPTNLPWGIVFPSVDATPRHPTQIYESLFHALCACLLAVLLYRGWFRGNLFKFYLILYAAYRFATEFIRPEARLAGGLTGYQWASLVLAAGFAWLWWRDTQSMKSAPIAAPKPA
jgi:phosphatidylglycerol:prolipoprotein diacylglycerol transferase